VTSKDRLSASVDADLVEAGRRAVRRGDATTFSSWVNEALRRHVAHQTRLQALEEFIADYESEQGIITDDEMASAARLARGRAVVVRGKNVAAGGRSPRRRT